MSDKLPTRRKLPDFKKKSSSTATTSASKGQGAPPCIQRRARRPSDPPPPSPPQSRPFRMWGSPTVVQGWDLSATVAPEPPSSRPAWGPAPGDLTLDDPPAGLIPIDHVANEAFDRVNAESKRARQEVVRARRLRKEDQRRRDDALNGGPAPKRSPEPAWTNFVETDDSDSGAKRVRQAGKERFKQFDGKVYFDRKLARRLKLNFIRPTSSASGSNALPYKMTSNSYEDMSSDDEFMSTKSERDEKLVLPQPIHFLSMGKKHLEASEYVYSTPTSAPRRLKDYSDVAHISPDPSFIPPLPPPPATIPLPLKDWVSPDPVRGSFLVSPRQTVSHPPTPSIPAPVKPSHQAKGPSSPIQPSTNVDQSVGLPDVITLPEDMSVSSDEGPQPPPTPIQPYTNADQSVGCPDVITLPEDMSVSSDEGPQPLPTPIQPFTNVDKSVGVIPLTRTEDMSVSLGEGPQPPPTPIQPYTNVDQSVGCPDMITLPEDMSVSLDEGEIVGDIANLSHTEAPTPSMERLLEQWDATKEAGSRLLQIWLAVSTTFPTPFYTIAMALRHLEPILGQPVREGTITAFDLPLNVSLPFDVIFIQIKYSDAGWQFIDAIRHFRPNAFRVFEAAILPQPRSGPTVLTPSDFIAFFERVTDPRMKDQGDNSWPCTRAHLTNESRARREVLGTHVNHDNQRLIKKEKKARKNWLKRMKARLLTVMEKPCSQREAEVKDWLKQLTQRRQMWADKILALGGDQATAWSGIVPEFGALILQVGGTP